MENNKYIDKISKKDLQEFVTMLKKLDFDFEEDKFISIVENTLKYISGDKDKRNDLRVIQELENKWYKSLEVANPDYSVYDDIYYLADTWVCWKKYSRQYLKSIFSPTSMATKSTNGYDNFKSIKDEIQANSLIDLGCGIGYTTSSLKEMFNCKTYGTNIKDTKQYKICQVLSIINDFQIVENFDDLGDIDLVFASEYFEHFERPVEHLIEVVEKLNPKYILFANTFNSKSIGHFDIYKHLDKDYSGPEMSKLFTKTLKSYKFKKVNTNCFNNRPNFYKR
jgi:2-polyprenyl-3-methyl-5-hydroxy-6-metoxy-1,4-benzoquinol methylase